MRRFKMINKQDEIKRIKDAKKNNKVYISPMIFGENAILLENILKGVIVKNNINLNDKGDKIC